MEISAGTGIDRIVILVYFALVMGFGAQLGNAGGAGIEDHLHYHIVPRWSGDTNFMPVVGTTKVMVEGLYETWVSLKSEFDAIKDIQNA